MGRKPLSEETRRAQLLALLTSLPAPCETSSDGVRRVGENGAEHIGKCVDALFNLVLAPDLSEPDQYPIYIPILRGQLTNLQYQYLESPKTILLNHPYLRIPTRYSCPPGSSTGSRWGYNLLRIVTLKPPPPALFHIKINTYGVRVGVRTANVRTRAKQDWRFSAA